MPNKPVHGLFDLDTWCYDIAFSVEHAEEGDLGERYCGVLVEHRFNTILKTLNIKTFEGYLTGDNNFRDQVATIAPYKGNRNQPRPKHYQYIRDYLVRNHRAMIIDGLEADDMLAIRQTMLGDKSVIISRDKDLRQVQGWHYGYKSGLQPEFKLKYFTALGELELKKKVRENNGKKITTSKLTGGGAMFLYAQSIMGDVTDNIKGLKGCGDAKAYEVLKDCQTIRELRKETEQLYVDRYKDEDAGLAAFRENMDLVFMVRDYDFKEQTFKKWSDYE